jgi:hypothetical protein
VPDDDVGHPGAHLRDERAISVPPAIIERGGVVTDDHLRIGEPDCRGVGGAVFLLALDAGCRPVRSCEIRRYTAAFIRVSDLTVSDCGQVPP